MIPLTPEIDLTQKHPLQKGREYLQRPRLKEVSKFSIEAYIARLMKMNQTMAYESILSKCQARFQAVSPEAVYAAVQSLVGSFNLKLSEERPNTYVYA